MLYEKQFSNLSMNYNIYLIVTTSNVSINLKNSTLVFHYYG